MQSNNFALRMPHSILEALRLAAASDGVAMNQYVNVAVAEKLATRQTAAAFLKARGLSGCKFLGYRNVYILVHGNAVAGRNEP